jgi:hypothetical protein
MNVSGSIERPNSTADDETSSVVDPQCSPTISSTSPSFPDTSISDAGYVGAHEQRDDSLSARAESVQSSKLKKKLSELDIRGAMADLDIRKGGKRHGIEDFYILLDEPHRMFWCPGEVVKGKNCSWHAKKLTY